jgi:glycerophosphoryl diester phosphodiesterase
MRNLLTSAIARPHFVAYDIRALPALAPLVAQHLFAAAAHWTVRTKEERDRALRHADAMIFEGITP